MDLKQANRVAFAIAEAHNITVEEAITMMNRSSVFLIAGDSILNSYSTQLAFITSVNIASRVFLGKVKCILPSNTANLLKLPAESFNDLVQFYGGTITKEEPTKEDFKILFGLPCFDNLCVEAISSGWRGGVNFYGNERISFTDISSRVSLGAVASASLAVYQAFCKVFNVNDSEMNLNYGISLWNLNLERDWFKDENEGPANPNLPRNVWALGLGHLGQAYLWTLGLMPYKNLKDTQILLQDKDIVGIENIGSQVLCFERNVGKPKTRPCLEFLESLDFKTQIIEKPFVEGDCKQEWCESYPFIINGVDNVKTRKSIDRSCFKLFLDGATNGKCELFDSFTMRNISLNQKEPDAIWSLKEDGEVILHKNLYEIYEKKHTCGQLTNIGISTPFVGLFSSTILVAELVRSLNQGMSYSVVSLQMRDLSSIAAIEAGLYDRSLLRFAV